jgi:hypothetical protein
MAGLGDLEKAIAELDRMSLQVNPMNPSATEQCKKW